MKYPIRRETNRRGGRKQERGGQQPDNRLHHGGRRLDWQQLASFLAVGEGEWNSCTGTPKTCDFGEWPKEEEVGPNPESE